MPGVKVALVIRDAQQRMAAARVFDGAPPWWTVRFYDEPPSDADVVVAGAGLDLPGALPFDAAAPHSVLERIHAALERGPGRCIAVTAASGGAGATTVALHLAAALARRRSTVVLDLDPERGAACRLGLPDEARAWSDLHADDDSVRRSALPVAGGFRLVMGAGPAEVAARVGRLHALFERVIVDVSCRGDMGEVATAAGVGVLVVTPTVPSVRRAARCLKHHASLVWAIVVNRVGAGGELTPAAVQRALGRRIALSLPCTPALRDAEDRCALLESRWSRWWYRIQKLARVLEQR